MASTRKSRSVNKRYSDYVDVSPTKTLANKSGRQKRKLSDMLGSPWTDEEVERFYKAYRKYGKDWKKVAAMVRTRNSEMVEALYTMNRAYLSLPEGTASVVGLVAMVSDHYNAMEGSDNDQEINDVSKLTRKPKKRTHQLPPQNNKPEDQLQFRVVGSSDRSLPPLKRRESDGCTVRKRTPRFPINHISRRENSGSYVSPHKRGQREDADDVAHGAALALTEGLQRGGSPQVSQSPHHMKTTPSKGRQKILDTLRTKLHGSLIDEDGFEGSSGSGGAENEEIYQKGKKLYIRKDDNEFDDGGEACSGTDENTEQSSSQGKRKRNKKLFFKDESSGLDALQTLADLSLMIQSESPVLKEDKPAAASTSHQRNKTKVPAGIEKALNEFCRSDVSKFGKFKPGRESKVDYKALSTGKQLYQSTNKSSKRKNKSFEAPENEEEKCANKLTGINEENAPTKISKSTKLVEYSSSNSNTSRTGAADSAISTALPSKRQNKRKATPNRVTKVNSKEKPNKKINRNLKDKAIGYLSSSTVRRWATYEWFYSAIDYPWFAKREFVEYLDHVGLGHIPRLTKVEWGVIRSSLGKPRRFSTNFLREEREKLWQYRESVRKHYTELRNGTREGLPTDLAHPLAVGQRVVAIHPESREVHDGSVLIVDHDKCRIQFDRPELGVAFVKDIDCMPLNLLDNMPEAFRENNALYRFTMISRETRLPQSVTGSLMLHTSSEQGPTIAMMSQRQGQNGSVSQIQSRESDICALSGLTRALDKKEAILTELKLVNDGLMNHKNETGTEMKVSESFKKEYAMVLVQLKEASEQVTLALLNLRQRNTYPVNHLPPWQKVQSSYAGVGGPTSSVDNFTSSNQLSSNVVEVVNGSRLEAHKLVHTAMQAMSKIKADQSVPSSVAAVFESLGTRKNPAEYVPSTFRPSEQGNGIVAYKHTPDLSQPLDSKSRGDSEATILSDLIVSCVATYQTIQTCSERQYPPGDVVQMIDSAFTQLRPQCSENLGIYREIEMCMGRVKTQILALVPS
ncbi:protein ALWAYS EARLY 3-like [Bidens hawaiensis]|uniref:protein ALWAYS EARLY 3-like n=1 Tax=Bidens hawaiensis TaxID=980011 RepID=UPI00404B7302